MENSDTFTAAADLAAPLLVPLFNILAEIINLQGYDTVWEH